ncbi:NAD(P)-binding protein [Rhizodiscina lignyota]|uniref:NAD(P)-binding protein n=1 Tax=Rhizodiscina lignyota TaxID=1504668 RepID=A0A9P4IHF1_9PEZI|nr:NAD(P)-binding protein [Rhizodiscina lignyota]
MGSSLSRLYKQSFNLPPPALTEKNLPDQAGKVHLVTGGYTGVGLKLVEILYQHNATVYVAGRSQSKANAAITKLKNDFPRSGGRVEFLQLDLADLPTIKPAVQAFQQKERRLDVLTLNAGVMHPPAGSKTAQGHDMQVGTNCLGHYLLAILLRPILEQTAATAPVNSVRITWAGSLEMDLRTPKGGMLWDNKTNAPDYPKGSSYGYSKVGDRYLAYEYARRLGKGSKVISICFNPGNLKTELQRHNSAIALVIVNRLLLYDAVFGAYTELWSGWSEDITKDNDGGYVLPWGRLGGNRKDLEEEMGKSGGIAEKFWDWCERETKAYL